MINTEISSCSDVPIYMDKMGNQYSWAGFDADELLKRIDEELKPYGLELLVGDCGSPEYFFCIVRKEQADELRK